MPIDVAIYIPVVIFIFWPSLFFNHIALRFYTMIQKSGPLLHL